MTEPNKTVNKFCSEINEGGKEGSLDRLTNRQKGSMDRWTNRQKGSMDRWTPVLSFFGSLAFSIKKMNFVDLRQSDSSVGTA